MNPEVGEDLADQARELWNVGMIPDDLVAWAWSLMQAIPLH